MKKAKKLLALLLALAMCVGVLASWSNNADQNSSAPVTESNQPSAEPANDTLVIAEDGMDGKFSPFFYTAVPDETVVNLTQLTLLGTDRNGAIVERALRAKPVSITAPTILTPASPTWRPWSTTTTPWITTSP